MLIVQSQRYNSVSKTVLLLQLASQTTTIVIVCIRMLHMKLLFLSDLVLLCCTFMRIYASHMAELYIIFQSITQQVSEKEHIFYCGGALGKSNPALTPNGICSLPTKGKCHFVINSVSLGW